MRTRREIHRPKGGRGVALYPDRDSLRAEYPELDEEDIRQALAFAAKSLDSQILPLEAA